jgi:hypothetical protein
MMSKPGFKRDSWKNKEEKKRTTKATSMNCPSKLVMAKVKARQQIKNRKEYSSI